MREGYRYLILALLLTSACATIEQQAETIPEQHRDYFIQTYGTANTYDQLYARGAINQGEALLSAYDAIGQVDASNTDTLIALLSSAFEVVQLHLGTYSSAWSGAIENRYYDFNDALAIYFLEYRRIGVMDALESMQMHVESSVKPMSRSEHPALLDAYATFSSLVSQAKNPEGSLMQFNGRRVAASDDFNRYIALARIE